MRKLVYTIALLFATSTIFIGCNSNDPATIVVTNPALLNQTVYANEEVGSSVQVTTLAPWTSSITETRSAANWLSITPASGNAGSHTITLNLQPNTTGTDRSAVVSIMSVNGDATISIRITQQGIRKDGTILVTDVTLNNSALELYVDDTKTLIATLLPQNATNQNVTWSSNYPDIASVDNNGKITAIAEGTATITVTTADGGKTATSEISVSNRLGIGAPTATTDPGVFIAGIRWATRNVDAPGTFAKNPQNVGMLYQWNRRIGWSVEDPLTASEPDAQWGDASLSTVWHSDNDPCPAGWRLPLHTELSALRQSGYTTTATWEDSGVYGRFFGAEPYTIFLPHADWRGDLGERTGFFGSCSVYGGVGTTTYWGQLGSACWHVLRISQPGYDDPWWCYSCRLFDKMPRDCWAWRCVNDNRDVPSVWLTGPLIPAYWGIVGWLVRCVAE